MSVNVQESAAQSKTLCEIAAEIIQPCVGLMSNFTFGYAVHPLEPAAPQFSEYLLISCHRLRIIHVKPHSTLKDDHTVSNHTEKKRVSRNLLSEEYWFTRWNKPLKLGTCNCSFRRSQRFSALSEQYLPLSVYRSIKDVSSSIHMSDICKSVSSYDIALLKITNVEMFVERLIQETVFEAFQEYFMKQHAKTECLSCNDESGATNLGFVNGEDEFNGVVLRKPLSNLISLKQDAVLEEGKEQSSSKGAHESHPEDVNGSCLQANCRQTKKKPVVILLHGIGSSADVWWNIVSILVHRGYEVVAPDMLGHGYSSIPDKANAYKFKNLLKYTLAVFDHYVGYDECKSSIVIGHSYGCSLATALCRYRSQQIVQLILISGGGPTPLAPLAQKGDTSILSCLQTLLKPLLLCGVKRTIFYSLRGKHFEPCDLNSAVPNHILQYIADGQNWPEGDAAFHRRILIPTLLVHGLQDTHVSLVQECEMERTIPRAFLELIPNAGHMCMLETPEHLSHMIMCFIDWWSR